MKGILIFVLLGIVLSSLPVFSQELYQYNVIAEIFNNNTVHYKLNLIFVNHSEQNFSVSLLSPQNIHIDTKADCSVQKKALGTEIACSMRPSSKTLIAVEYDSSEILIKKENYFLFTDSFRMFSETETVSVIVKLPEGSGLKEPIENSFSPPGALKGSDGRRTILYWELKDLKSGERFDVSIAFESVGVIFSLIPIEILIIFILLLIVGSAFAYRIYSQRTVKLILPILKEDEKKIFNTLMKHGNGVKQNIVVKDSGYSKAKVSKVLKSLNERGIIKLERIGRSNKIYIEKNLQKS